VCSSVLQCVVVCCRELQSVAAEGKQALGCWWQWLVCPRWVAVAACCTWCAVTPTHNPLFWSSQPKEELNSDTEIKCVHVCVMVCVCVGAIYVYIYICECIYIYTYTYIHIHSYIYVYKWQLYVFIHTYMIVRGSYIYIFTYINECTCTYI